VFWLLGGRLKLRSHNGFYTLNWLPDILPSGLFSHEKFSPVQPLQGIKVTTPDHRLAVSGTTRGQVSRPQCKSVFGWSALVKTAEKQKIFTVGCNAWMAVASDGFCADGARVASTA
jgi:hypothetical protein